MALLYTAVLSKIKNRYLRAQAVALIATGVDFSMTVLLKEVSGLFYVSAVCIGAICGAITAFTLNRSWVFMQRSGVSRQAFRYLVALGGSVLLNSLGTFAITELFGIPYLVSKVLISVCIGLTYSYFVLKSFVFYERAGS